MIQFIEYPPCSTCQKAKKWLEENGIPYTAYQGTESLCAGAGCLAEKKRPAAEAFF